MNVDDQAPGIGKEESRVVRRGTDVEDDSRHVIGVLGGANSREKPVAGNSYGFSHQRWCKPGIAQVEVNPIRASNTGSPIWRLIVKIDGNAGVTAGDPIANRGDPR